VIQCFCRSIEEPIKAVPFTDIDIVLKQKLQPIDRTKEGNPTLGEIILININKNLKIQNKNTKIVYSKCL